MAPASVPATRVHSPPSTAQVAPPRSDEPIASPRVRHASRAAVTQRSRGLKGTRTCFSGPSRVTKSSESAPGAAAIPAKRVSVTTPASKRCSGRAAICGRILARSVACLEASRTHGRRFYIFMRPLWTKARQITAIAASGHLDQRPEMSMRTPQTSAMSESRRLTVMVNGHLRVLPCWASKSMTSPAVSVPERSEQAVDSCQAGVEDPRLHPITDAQVALGAEVDAGDDHRRVLANEAVDKCHRLDGKPVAEEADPAGLWRRPVQLARMRRRPVLELRPALAEDEARALQQLGATLECDLGERLGHGRWRDRRVVLETQRGLRLILRRDEPADPKTGQPVHLRKPTGDDNALAASGEGCALDAVELRATVHLVGEDPRAVFRGDRDDAIDLRARQDLPGRVVRRADADELGPPVDRGCERVEVDVPATLLTQPHLAHAGAEALRDAVHLHVVRHHDDDLVAGGHERHQREEVRLARPGRDDHVLRVRARMESRDQRARRLAPDALRVAELRAHELLLIARDLFERQRLDPGLGQVVLHPVLPGGLHALHVERGELHRSPPSLA